MTHDFFHNPIVRCLLVILVTLLLQMFSRQIIERIVRRVVSQHRFENKNDEKKREDTIITVLRTGINVLLWFVAILVVLDALGVNLAAAATGAGVFGVVIGLGAQSTIKDFLAGIFILLENQYRVGDIVTLSGGTTGTGVSGVVEEITLRITKLRDLDGTLNVVRNGEASIITNRTFEYSSVVVDVTVVYDTDVDAVEKVMDAVGLDIAGREQWQSLIVQPIKFLRIDSFGDSGVVARAVGRVAPASQWDIAGAYRRELLKAFRKAGVHVALPQVVVHQAKK